MKNGKSEDCRIAATRIQLLTGSKRIRKGGPATTSMENIIV